MGSLHPEQWRQSPSYTFASAQAAGHSTRAAGCSPAYAFAPPLTVRHTSGQPPCSGEAPAPYPALTLDLISPTSPLDSCQFVSPTPSSVSSAASGLPPLRTPPGWCQDLPTWGQCESPGRRSATPSSRGSRRVQTIRKSASDAAALALELYKQDLRSGGNSQAADSGAVTPATPWGRRAKSAQGNNLAELLIQADWGPLGDSPRSVASKLRPLPETPAEAPTAALHSADSVEHTTPWHGESTVSVAPARRQHATQRSAQFATQIAAGQEHAANGLSAAAISLQLVNPVDAAPEAAAAQIGQHQREQDSLLAAGHAGEHVIDMPLDECRLSQPAVSGAANAHAAKELNGAAQPRQSEPACQDQDQDRQGEASTSYPPQQAQASPFRTLRRARVSPEIVAQAPSAHAHRPDHKLRITAPFGIAGQDGTAVPSIDNTAVQLMATPEVLAAFVALAEAAFLAQPDRFAAVLQLVHDHSSGALPIQAVAEQAMLLLKDHPDLLRRYSAFMPAHISLTLSQSSSRTRRRLSQQQLRRSPDAAKPKRSATPDLKQQPGTTKSPTPRKARHLATGPSQLKGAGQVQKGRKYMLVMRNLNGKQFRGVARDLRRDGVRIGSMLGFADWLAPPANQRYLPWCTFVVTAAIVSLFFFMAGSFALYLDLTTTSRSTAQQQSAAAEVVHLDAYQLTSPRSLLHWLSFNPGWRVFSFDYLLAWGGRYGPAIAEGQWYRWGTSVLVHTSFQHLLANMLLLVALAGLLEVSYGTWRIALVWVISALGAAFTSATFEPACTLVVGASGSVFGFLGLAIADLLLNFRSLTQPLLRLAFTLATIAFFVVTSITKGSNSFVSNWSHVGGFVCGLFPSFLFLPNIRDRRWRAAKKLAVKFGFLKDTSRRRSGRAMHSVPSVRLHPRVVASISHSQHNSRRGLGQGRSPPGANPAAHPPRSKSRSPGAGGSLSRAGSSRKAQTSLVGACAAALPLQSVSRAEHSRHSSPAVRGKGHASARRLAHHGAAGKARSRATSPAAGLPPHPKRKSSHGRDKESVRRLHFPNDSAAQLSRPKDVLQFDPTGGRCHVQPAERGAEEAGVQAAAPAARQAHLLHAFHAPTGATVPAHWPSAKAPIAVASQGGQENANPAPGAFARPTQPGPAAQTQVKSDTGQALLSCGGVAATARPALQTLQASSASASPSPPHGQPVAKAAAAAAAASTAQHGTAAGQQASTPGLQAMTASTKAAQQPVSPAAAKRSHNKQAQHAPSRSPARSALPSRVTSSPGSSGRKLRRRERYEQRRRAQGCLPGWWKWAQRICMLLGVVVMVGVFVAMPLYLYLDKLRDLHC